MDVDSAGPDVSAGWYPQPMTQAPVRRSRRGDRAPAGAGEAAGKAGKAGVRRPAATRPVARVAVDVQLAHLDRPFDYLIPENDDAAVEPGVRVRVRFAGRLVDGYVLERLERSEHDGKLGFLEKVVSAESVLAPEIAELARAVADRYVGVLPDVLRLAVPPRHARVEREGPKSVETPPIGHGRPPASDAGPDTPGPAWDRYRAGPAFLDAVRAGRPARAVWQALPGEDWAGRFADAAAVASAAGRGALLLVPDAGDLARIDVALRRALPGGEFVTLAADLGPAERYRRFLAIRRGTVRVVAGTRSAALAPVTDLGLLAIWDDGDDLYAEPRAPYPHAREVLLLRSTQQAAPLLIGGLARTAEAQLLLDSGWAREVAASRAEVRRSAPRIEAAGDEHAVGADSAAAHARLSPAAFRSAREALAAGAPVLVQVPRRGYLPGLACARCRRPSRCRHCRGPLSLRGSGGIPTCRWCGLADAHANCAACGSTELRSTSVGTRRTAEELGRAFPKVPLVLSAGGTAKHEIDGGPVIVVATPGAEPVVPGGYGAALLLDGRLLLARPDLRAAEEALRRWMAAAALVRPAGEGGRVVVGADASLATVQALIRWDPAGHAALELEGRRELGFPPTVAMASLEGTEPAVLAAIDQLELPPDGEVLGPVPVEDHRRDTDRPGGEERVRALVRAPQSRRKDLQAALRHLAAGRSARKDGAAVRTQIDPPAPF